MRRWLAGRTLRARLIAGLVALLFVACAAVGVVTYLSLHGFLLGQLDDQLQEASMRFTTCVDGPPGDHPSGPDSAGEQPGDGDADRHDPARCADTPGQAQGTFSAALRSGAVTAANVTYGQCKLSAADMSALARLPTGGRARTERLASLDATYRLTAKPGDDGQVLIPGLPAAPMTGTLNNVELAEAIVFAAALLLTGLFGTGWVRLSLRPLRRVTATAAQVARLPLASQVDLPHR